jgi:hypothetical protein
MAAITHQNNSIIANSMRILNSIIDGSTERDQNKNANNNRSSSLHNLHLHSVAQNGNSENKSLSLSLRTLHENSRRNPIIASDQSPLWTALTTSAQISFEIDS